MLNHDTASEYALVAAASEARDKSKAKFSKFRVGVALEARNGRIFQAFNVESSSYGLSMCAERIAVWEAITAGESEFTRIAIVSDAEDFCSPCGACRQVLYELAGNIEVYMTNSKGELKKESLSALLPDAFTSKTLLNGRD